MSSFSITLGTPGLFRLVGLFAYDLIGAADVAQLNLFSGFIGNANWRWQSMTLLSALAQTSCAAPMSSTRHQECVWRRPLIS